MKYETRAATRNIACPALLVALAAVPPPAQAFEESIVVAPISPDTIVIDGSVIDWEEAGYPCATLGKNHVVSGSSSWSGKDDYSMQVCAAYDEANVYLSLFVDDDRQVRTMKPTPAEDHVEIWMDLPPYGAGDRLIVQFFPERKFPTFKTALRLVTSDGKVKPIKAKLSMQSSSTGWEAEIALPFKSLPGLLVGLAGARWAFVGVDYDGVAGASQPDTVLATALAGPIDSDAPLADVVKTVPGDLEVVDAVMAAFQKTLGIESVTPKVVYADVAMDSRLEVLAKALPLIGIMGPGFMSGVSYVFIELGANEAKDVISVDVMDVTGDGKADVVAKYVAKGKTGSITMLAVYSFVAEEMRRILAQEIAVDMPGKSITCKTELKDDGPGGSKMLLVTPGEAKGWTQATFKSEPGYGVGGVLAPWDATGRMLWVLTGMEYKQADATKIDSYLEAKPEKGKAKGKKGKKKGK